MEITETSGSDGQRLIQQIHLDEIEVENLLNGEEVSKKIYSGGVMEPGDLQRVIEIRSEYTLISLRELQSEISRLENKKRYELRDGDVDIYDDVMEALFEMIAALSDMNKRIESGHNPLIVYRDILESYDIQKCIDTYDYYDLMREDYR